MDKLTGISFLYRGVPFSKTEKETLTKKEDNRTVTEYTLPDGLKVTSICTEYHDFGVYELVNYLENTGEMNSGIISELLDVNVTLPLDNSVRDADWGETGVTPYTKVFAPNGSMRAADDFLCDVETPSDPTRPMYLFEGDVREFGPEGGRGSSGALPFFDVNRADHGVIYAVGWTGQWHARISRGKNDVSFSSGVETTHFRLYPGEKIRTTSAMVMPYSEGQTRAHNRWRRFIRLEISPFKDVTRPNDLPLTCTFWGGLNSDALKERLHYVGQNNLQFEQVWVDAGWYGIDTKPSENEFVGDWALHTGDWRVSPLIHPNGWKDSVDVMKQYNMRFMLWFEPERVIKGLPITQEHPEYFLTITDPNTKNSLLNLGDEEALQYCIKTIGDLIEEFDVATYRQDYNIRPLVFWRENEAEDRQGLVEIKYICGLYRFWDALLERFPHLIIDNCAGGGRRLDIETLKRSAPLHRTDYTCYANYSVEAVQSMMMGCSWWMPHTGTGTQKYNYDTYRARSSYSSGMSCPTWFSYSNPLERSPEELEWTRNMIAEFKAVREFFSCDYYPLTEVTVDSHSWCGYRFERPETNEGIMLIFKRPNSNIIQCCFKFENIRENSIYEFRDADTGEIRVMTSNELAEGYIETIVEQRTAKLYFYSIKE